MKLKNLTLIRPNMGDYRSKDALPPLALSILAALTPPSVTISFYDDRIERIPFEKDMPDMVALSVETFTARRAYEIAKVYRDRNIIVVMGGYHPTLLPEEVLQYADVVVIGDAEGVWEQLLEDFEHDTLKQIYTNPNEMPLDAYKLDRTIFKTKKYLPVELIQFSRGCKHSCDFCSIEAFYHHKVRVRPIDSVVAELKTLNKKHLIFFVDDNLFSTKENLHKLLKAITPLKIRWSCQISIDVARDEALLDHMASAGCVFALIGFESLVYENLEQMGKKWNKNSGDYIDIVDKFHQRGIAVYGTFVFGYDHDTVETIAQSVQFAMDAKLEIANFNPLTPTPNTGLYNRLIAENRLKFDQWWLDPNFHYGDSIFAPKKIDADMFAAQCYEAKQKFYAYPSIFKRIFLSKLKWRPFLFFVLLLANVVSKKEIKNKHHRRLGQ